MFFVARQRPVRCAKGADCSAALILL